MKYLIITNILLLLSNCANSGSDEKERDNDDSIQAHVQKQGFNSVDVEKSIGIISLNGLVPFSEKDTIKLFNDDGSLWHQFSYSYDDSDGKYDFQNENFKPYLFHPDYFLLGLVVTEILDSINYKVIVNKNSSLEKVITVDEKLVLNTWEEAVLKSTSISFDDSINSIKDAQSLDANSLELPVESIIKPVSISNDWLKIEWQFEGEKRSGWIQWKRNGLLVIKLSFLT